MFIEFWYISWFHALASFPMTVINIVVSKTQITIFSLPELSFWDRWMSRVYSVCLSTILQMGLVVTKPLTKRDSNQSPQLQRLACKLKFHLLQVEIMILSKKRITKACLSNKLLRPSQLTYTKYGYRWWLDMDIMQQSACLVLNPIKVDSYGFLFNCMTTGQASDLMTALT